MVRFKLALDFYRMLRKKEIACRHDLCAMLTFQAHADIVREYLERRIRRYKELNGVKP